MGQLLHKYALLPLRDKWFLLRIAMLVILLRVVVKLIPFPRLNTLIDRLWRKPALYHYAGNLAYTQRVVWFVARAGKHLLHRRCLVEALAIHILLARRRIVHQMHIGFARKRQGFVAHAWVEADGTILTNEDQNLQFYFTIPSRRLHHEKAHALEDNGPSRA